MLRLVAESRNVVSELLRVHVHVHFLKCAFMFLDCHLEGKEGAGKKQHLPIPS